MLTYAVLRDESGAGPRRGSSECIYHADHTQHLLLVQALKETHFLFHRQLELEPQVFQPAVGKLQQLQHAFFSCPVEDWSFPFLTVFSSRRQEKGGTARLPAQIRASESEIARIRASNLRLEEAQVQEREALIERTHVCKVSH
jgi:hypothetical protein